MSRPGTCALFACAILLAGSLGREASAGETTVFWSGTVESITEFNDGALPAGIEVGDAISGTLCFDRSAYDWSSSILGNVSSGKRFIYELGLEQSVSIDDWTWMLDSGILTLSDSLGRERRAFDVFTSSHSNLGFGFVAFPGYVGNFELGFVVADEEPPLEIFDLYDLDSTSLDMNQATEGGGFITSRAWNEGGDIVDGYYLTFEILEVPEPGSALAAQTALWTLAWLATRRARARRLGALRRPAEKR